MENCGILSLAPAVIAIVLALITREALLAILCGVLVGIWISGQNLIFGFSSLIQNTLGTADFVWVVSIELFIGIMVAFFQKSGAMAAVSDYLINRVRVTARAAKVLAALLGVFIFFSDYFSPLFVGNVMRPITDKARISREKLSFICDCTSAPKCVIVPFAAWGVYVAGLLVSFGAPFNDIGIGLSAVAGSVKYQFYGILILAVVLLNALGLIPDFGSMRKAEKRARETGKVVADGDTPMISEEVGDIIPAQPKKFGFIVHFFMPAAIVMTVSVWTWKAGGSAKVLESFILAVAYQAVVLLVQRSVSAHELVSVAVKGIKSVLGAILILALAYCLNSISKTLGTSNYVISVAQGWITAESLLMFSFGISAFMAFFTGTSWGVYAIMVPIVMPLALQISSEANSPVVCGAIAAVMGGGCFGDHCSPLSDTTVLSSLGAGSDHIAHVKTQIPYALMAAVISLAAYMVVGMVVK